MDKYDANNDHYCYPNTTVLKNKLNIQDMNELENAEREITALTIQSINFKKFPYDLNYMKELHFKLFSNLYTWAGQVRDVDISKGGTRFCTCSRIEIEAKKLFSQLEGKSWLTGLEINDFCEKLAEFYIEFNMIHPFREGNGRVQRLLFEHIALAASYDLNWDNVSKTEWIQANIDGVNVNYSPMEAIFKRIVTSI
ncbi:putative adenosine monophosphate-protein transferase Fic [Acinetobacter radioresistens]|uniref:putative adenosine monophosphate-protein transferase Fic n=1 Tax=Acinetobacter radioresistens TaxID=40216 RepID=UPI0020034EFC|nr:putative adenosine monophosphate-protein transferase Fic [Acinetobacter radioresistens]MCK4091349.1 putative adenosine monophosphate-protein transferase Fic [Acinetobacter radioresistens]